MSNLLWLAAYPKSGSTWIRAVLAAYDAGEAFALDRLPGIEASSLRMFADHAGIEATDLPPDIMKETRPWVFRSLALSSPPGTLVKTHDAWSRTPSGRDLFPADASTAAIYIVRNPLDVAVSWSFHAGIAADEAVAFLGNRSATLSAAGAWEHARELPQELGSWSHHVASWTEQRAIPVHMVRYEDLVTAPEGSLARLVAATGRTLDESRLRTAIEATSFARLQRAEDVGGFSERPLGAGRFFRAGKVGGFRQYLSTNLIDRLWTCHSDVMSRFGYHPDAK